MNGKGDFAGEKKGSYGGKRCDKGFKGKKGGLGDSSARRDEIRKYEEVKLGTSGVFITESLPLL